MAVDDDLDKRWAGGELLVCAVIQLALVNVAYRIDRYAGAPLVSTSSWAIIFGLICGAVLASMSETRVHSAGLDPEILFFGLLPPIILEAGFNTQRKGFFSNFWAILLLAIVGTLIATFVTGWMLVWMGQRGWITQFTDAEAFLYGSLISAIDPVATLLVFKKCKAPSMLFNLVFGESVLNDAVGTFLLEMLPEWILFGSYALSGIVFCSHCRLHLIPAVRVERQQ
jgi:solute carrier family 9 (sodium/hydrogen exchanger), member 8